MLCDLHDFPFLLYSHIYHSVDENEGKYKKNYIYKIAQGKKCEMKRIKIDADESGLNIDAI